MYLPRIMTVLESPVSVWRKLPRSEETKSPQRSTILGLPFWTKAKVVGGKHRLIKRGNLALPHLPHLGITMQHLQTGDGPLPAKVSVTLNNPIYPNCSSEKFQLPTLEIKESMTPPLKVRSHQNPMPDQSPTIPIGLRKLATLMTCVEWFSLTSYLWYRPTLS